MSLNLTPMIDVVFQLLLFFMVACRFGGREGMLPAQLPARAAAAGEIPRTPIRVRLVADSASPEKCQVTIDHFNESPMPMSSLAKALRQIQDPQQGFDGATPVHLLAGDDVVWDHVVNAYSAAMSARYEKIFFVGLP